MPKDVGLRIKALHWNRHECVTTTRHQGQEDRQTQWFCDFSLDRHHLGFSTVEVFYESPGLFCFQSELATVSQTRRWDKTKLRREPGTLFECMWTVCLFTAQFVLHECVHTQGSSKEKRKCLYILVSSAASPKPLVFTANSVQSCSCDWQQCNCWYVLPWNREPCNTKVGDASSCVTATGSWKQTNVTKKSHWLLCHTFRLLLHLRMWTPAQCLNVLLKARQHRGQSHRKPRRQTTSHPAWALKENASSSRAASASRSLTWEAAMLCRVMSNRDSVYLLKVKA